MSKRKKGRSQLSTDNLRVSVHRAIERGDYKEALKNARVCYRKEASEANRLLSVGKAMADADAGLGASGLLVGESGQGYAESEVLFETLSRAVAAGVLASEKAATIRGLLETLSAPTVSLERALVKAGIRMTPVELGRRCDREH